MFEGILNPNDENWQEQAECAKRANEVHAASARLGTDIFYPETGRSREAFKEAMKFCEGCPVLVKCYYDGKYEMGTWGGATEKERKRQARLSGTLLSALLARMGAQSQDENKSPSEELDHDPAA